MKITVRLDGLEADIGIKGAAASKEISIDLPKQCDDQLASMLKKDIQILNENSENLPELVNSLLGKDPQRHAALLKNYGMDEESAMSDGGGLLVAAVIIVGMLLYSQHAH